MGIIRINVRIRECVSVCVCSERVVSVCVCVLLKRAEQEREGGEVRQWLGTPSQGLGELRVVEGGTPTRWTACAPEADKPGSGCRPGHFLMSALEHMT